MKPAIKTIRINTAFPTIEKNINPLIAKSIKYNLFENWNFAEAIENTIINAIIPNSVFPKKYSKNIFLKSNGAI